MTFRAFWYQDHPDRYATQTAALNAARHHLGEAGGVMYDDTRAFVVADAAETDVPVRISGDQISHDDAARALDRMQAAGVDWSTPVTRSDLLAFAR